LLDDSRPYENATRRRRAVKIGRSSTLNPGGDIRFGIGLHG
jgi:hypothetical protein